MRSSSVGITRTFMRLPTLEYHARVGRVAGRVQFNAQKLQPGANAGPHLSRVLADAAGKHQRIKPAQHGRECSYSLAGLVA